MENLNQLFSNGMPDEMNGTTQAYVIDANGYLTGVAEIGTRTVSGVGNSVEIVTYTRRIQVVRRLRGGTPGRGVQKLTVTIADSVPRRQKYQHL